MQDKLETLEKEKEELQGEVNRLNALFLSFLFRLFFSVYTGVAQITIKNMNNYLTGCCYHLLKLQKRKLNFSIIKKSIKLKTGGLCGEVFPH